MSNFYTFYVFFLYILYVQYVSAINLRGTAGENDMMDLNAHVD